jgi:cell division protein FtsL
LRAAELPQPRLRLIGKPVRASAAEVAANPRARSAVMRVAEKLPERPPEMVRLNIFLLLAVVICSLGVVTSQHKARKIFQALEASRSARGNSRSSSGSCNWNCRPGERRPRIEKIAARSSR